MLVQILYILNLKERPHLFVFLVFIFLISAVSGQKKKNTVFNKGVRRIFTGQNLWAGWLWIPWYFLSANSEKHI
jgi:uncharacterized membrane protein (DUF106 family)